MKLFKLELNVVNIFYSNWFYVPTNVAFLVSFIITRVCFLGILTIRNLNAGKIMQKVDMVHHNEIFDVA